MRRAATSPRRSRPRLAFQHDGESLPDADADRDDCDAAPATSQLVCGVTDDAPSGRSERVSDRQCAAVDVQLLGVKVGPAIGDSLVFMYHLLGYASYCSYGHREVASVISIAIHAFAIVVLVGLTARETLAPRPRRETIAILDLAAMPAPPPPPSESAPATIADKPRGFQTLAAPTEVPTTIPEPAASALDPADYSGRGVEGGVAGGTAPPATETPRYFELADVSVMPRMIRVVKPQFPGLLDPETVRGTVLIEAILLEDGRVDPATLVTRGSLHPLIDEACRRALTRSRFSPAQFGGRPVKVAILVPYVFGPKGG